MMSPIPSPKRRQPVMWLTGRALYWADARNNDIGMYHLDTRQQRILLREPSAHYFGLFVMGDFLYVTDWKRRYGRYCSDAGCERRQTISSTVTRLFFSFCLQTVNMT